MLKPRLQETMLDIHNFYSQNNRMPTITELARAVDGNPKSLGCIQYRIAQLVEAGYLVRGECCTARTMSFGKQIGGIGGKIPVLGTCN